jgi:uncharacterized protein (TIGR03083 family)
MTRDKLLQQLETAWASFQASFAGLGDAQMTEPGVTGEWSVKEILAHVTTWEQEALKSLPIILAGGKLPRYSVLYGGIDAFNAQTTEQKRRLPLGEVLAEMEATHRQLVAQVRQAPEEVFSRETRYRRRLRLDTYSHYPIHETAIREWRQQKGL